VKQKRHHKIEETVARKKDERGGPKTQRAGTEKESAATHRRDDQTTGGIGAFPRITGSSVERPFQTAPGIYYLLNTGKQRRGSKQKKKTGKEERGFQNNERMEPGSASTRTKWQIARGEGKYTQQKG